MAIALLLIFLVMVGYIRELLPVQGLSYIDAKELNDLTSPAHTEMKWLDVRDSSDFERCHLEGAINASIGRLPFVWHKDFSVNDTVLIFADSSRLVNRAVRYLRRQGFSDLYAVRRIDCVNQTIKSQVVMKVGYECNH